MIARCIFSFNHAFLEKFPSVCAPLKEGRKVVSNPMIKFWWFDSFEKILLLNIMLFFKCALRWGGVSIHQIELPAPVQDGVLATRHLLGETKLKRKSVNFKNQTKAMSTPELRTNWLLKSRRQMTTKFWKRAYRLFDLNLMIMMSFNWMRTTVCCCWSSRANQSRKIANRESVR